jgi:phage protein D
VNIAPDFLVVANGADITATILSRFKSLRFTDEAGVTADTLEINLADHDPAAPIAMPPTGAELELSLGYNGVLRKMGLFVVDEIELSGWPGTMTIRARAAPYEASTGGKTDLQTQKSRSWKAGTTIGALVAKIAGEHSLKPAVSPSLSSIALPHTDQSSESDMNLLVRLAKRYDAIAKPAGGNLVFAARGESQSVGGVELPRITLQRNECSDFRLTLARRDSPGTVIAYYRDAAKAERREVKVGTGDPVKRLRLQYRDKDSAKAAAQAEQRKRARGEAKLSLRFPGRPDVTAEATIILPDSWREGVAGEWLVTHAEHYLGPQGYNCSVDCERPNSSEEVEGKADAVDDAEQPNVDEGGGA